MNKVYYLFISVLIISCNTPKFKINQNVSEGYIKNKSLNDQGLKKWYLSDIVEDTIPDISLNKALEFLKEKKSSKLKIAVLDATTDIHHEDLKKSIWTNNLEKLNGSDDDNGLIDDLRIEFAIKNNEAFRNYKVSAIAKECGFNNSETFSKLFKKRFSIYPSFFVKELNKRRPLV